MRLLLLWGLGHSKCLLTLGWIAEAMELMILSLVGPVVKSQWDLSPGQESLLSTVVFAGMLVGAFSWGLVSDYYGRRQAIFLLFPSILRCFALEGFAGTNYSYWRSWIIQYFLPKLRIPVDSSLLGWRWRWRWRDDCFLLLVSRVCSLLECLFLIVQLDWMKNLLRQNIPLYSQLSREQSKSGSSTVLRSENLQDDSLHVDVFITSLAEIPGLILSAVVVDTIGRRLSISFMFASACIFLSPLFYHQSATLTTTLMFGARMSSRVLSTLATIYAQEVSPGIHAFRCIRRATGFGVASAVRRVGGMITPLVAVGLVTGGHHTEAIILLDIVMAMSGLCVLLIPVQTKGHEFSDSVDVSDSKQVVAAGQ
ncbi:PREDICTED: organic cation/carnitine transporter 7-like [Populus euphratica]|uniref:Organic cation/carnitine transporter 7-like n=1 Tax=Populus euphratica TaxID=75702 RepID=A0AAJ6TW37_POPEU|nr:PREDICTED: organic cation/carnitine transporter 7-like [Populus euphratica]